MTTASTSEAKLPVPVLTLPHWRVVIHPETFLAERIPSLDECWNLIRTTSVQFRGWEYPFVGEHPNRRDADAISSWIDWGEHLEYWKFWQSAQFVHLLGFWEDRRDLAPDERRRLEAVVERAGIGFESSGHLEPTGVVYALSEIFEFASRLSSHLELHEGMTISVEMRDVANRILLSRDQRRFWTDLYRLEVDQIGHTWESDALLLRTNARELAVEAALWFFDKFGWNPPREIIASDQERLYARRF